MPAKSPASSPYLERLMQELGQQVRDRRKYLKLSAVATAESAGISRMTLNRIEKGEPSVTLGAYINVASVLGLELKALTKDSSRESPPQLPPKVSITDYPQLKKLAWQITDSTELNLEQAFNLYERNWKYVDKQQLTEVERQFILQLLKQLGRSDFLV
jgi:transcriptional regulator with XRE-family HTH domain